MSRKAVIEEQFAKSREELLKGCFDGLLVATRFHPEPIVLSLLPFLSPSRPFVVYCPFIELLANMYTGLKERGSVFDLHLSDTWLRQYQGQQSNHVCNALALLQCVASHPETRSAFLQAHIPYFLYPFLHTVSKSRPFEYLGLTSLGVVGALVKTDEPDVINFLLTTEIIPLCLGIMESGSELCKTVATFILQKILLDNTGLVYICQTYETFSHVAMVLGKMVNTLGKEPSVRLLKHVIRCYLQLSDNTRAREALRQCLPDQLKDATLSMYLKDENTKKWLSQLMQNLSETV